MKSFDYLAPREAREFEFIEARKRLSETRQEINDASINPA